MPDRRQHRGPHPEDGRLFARELWARMRQARFDFCWLLTRGYASESALKLVGDRYGLVARQRMAIGRCSCSDAAAERRQRHCRDVAAMAGQSLWLDGYNVLTTVEAALAGGVVLPGREGAYRDLASMHGSFRRVVETLPALELIGDAMACMGVGESVWYLDRPVSNSGRLKQTMEELGVQRGWPWRVELAQDPDAILAETDQIVATADSVILDRCQAWFNLAHEVVCRRVPEAWVVDLVQP